MNRQEIYDKYIKNIRDMESRVFNTGLFTYRVYTLDNGAQVKSISSINMDYDISRDITYIGDIACVEILDDYTSSIAEIPLVYVSNNFARLTEIVRTALGYDTEYVLDLSDMNLNSILDASNMFACLDNKFVGVKLPTGDKGLKPIRTSAMFKGTQFKDYGFIRDIRYDDVVYMNQMFMQSEVKSIDFSGIKFPRNTECSEMFKFCNKLETVKMDKGSVPLVANLYEMFYGCDVLKEFDLDAFKQWQHSNCASMFCMCENIREINISNPDKQEKYDGYSTASFSTMFSGCGNLRVIDMGVFLKKVHLSSLNSNSFYKILDGCNSLEWFDGYNRVILENEDITMGCWTEQNVGIFSGYKGNIANISGIRVAWESDFLPVIITDLFDFNLGVMQDMPRCIVIDKYQNNGYAIYALTELAGYSLFRCEHSEVELIAKKTALFGDKTIIIDESIGEDGRLES